MRTVIIWSVAFLVGTLLCFLTCALDVAFPHVLWTDHFWIWTGGWFAGTVFNDIVKGKYR